MTKRIITGLIVLIMFQGTNGQTKLINLKGTLTTKNGDAIPGCNVVLKGELMEASTTQVCGDFEIYIPDNYRGVLVFSCLAPRTWEIPLKKLKDKLNIIISLTDWDRFNNGPCDRNYKKEKRIKIY